MYVRVCLLYCSRFSVWYPNTFLFVQQQHTNKTAAVTMMDCFFLKPFTEPNKTILPLIFPSRVSQNQRRRGSFKDSGLPDVDF